MEEARRERQISPSRIPRYLSADNGIGLNHVELARVRPVLLKRPVRVLVVPKRHRADFFDLGTAESRACC
jgi:hypothetical protein